MGIRFVYEKLTNDETSITTAPTTTRQPPPMSSILDQEYQHGTGCGSRRVQSEKVKGPDELP